LRRKERQPGTKIAAKWAQSPSLGFSPSQQISSTGAGIAINLDGFAATGVFNRQAMGDDCGPDGQGDWLTRLKVIGLASTVRRAGSGRLAVIVWLCKLPSGGVHCWEAASFHCPKEQDMADFTITCRTMTARDHTGHQHVEWVGWDGRRQMSRHDMVVQLIRRKTAVTAAENDSHRLAVGRRYCHAHAYEYLTTKPDQDLADNLDNLPDCPM
jgi:hypothetical protein